MNIRIFFSSPGDVKMERETAKRIVDRLQSEIGGNATIEPYFWEHEVMVATKDYQENIPQMDDFDIVVCILWSRLGTPLDPTRHPRPGGGGFASGTEYEFVTAMKAHEVKGTPDIFVFRNTTEPRRPSRPKEVRDAVDNEIDRLDSFFDDYFQDETFFTRAINIYSTLGEFEEKLTIALRSYITGRIPSSPSKLEEKRRRSYDRQPYLGLASFDYEDAPVFFGRTAQTGEIISVLQNQELEAQTNGDAPPKHFVLILGSSGSGKSSLARAGVLPMLTNPGVIEGANAWRTAIFKPADVAGDPILALVNCLAEPRALPELFADGTTPKEIADLIRTQPQGGGLLLRQALTQASALALTEEKQRLAGKLEQLIAGHRDEDAEILREKIDKLKTPAVRIALLADQLEELFTSDLSPDTLKAFVEILVAMANSGRIFLIGTLRSDFYPRCLEHQALVDLMQGNGSYALPAPSAADIGQMIRQPAAIAGLTFEENATSGEKLDELLRDAALKDPAALPLLSYTLEQLYEQRTADGELTLDAYHSLGGLEGAIGSRAETVFLELPSDAQAAFDPLCKQLVTLRDGGEPTRRRAYYSTLIRTPESKSLVDALVNARLLTADQSPDGERVIAVAHEALLRHWPRLVSWVEENRLFLNTRTRVASRMADWIEKYKADEYLIPRGPNLSAAESILTGHLASLDPLEIEFIGRSAERVRSEDQRRLRNARLITVGAVVLCLFAVAGGIIALFANNAAQKERKIAISEKKNAVEARAKAVAGETRIAYTKGIQLLETGQERDGLTALVQTLAIEPEHPGALARIYSEQLYAMPRPLPIYSSTAGKEVQQRVGGALHGPLQNVVHLSPENRTAIYDINAGKLISGPWEKDRPAIAPLISYDGTRVLSLRQDMSLISWDVKTGKEGAILQVDPKFISMWVTIDGKYIIEGNSTGEMRVLSSEDGEVFESWKPNGIPLSTFSTGSRYFISITAEELQIYDREKDKLLDPIPAPEGYTYIDGNPALPRYPEQDAHRCVIRLYSNNSNPVLHKLMFLSPGEGKFDESARNLVLPFVVSYMPNSDGSAVVVAPHKRLVAIYPDREDGEVIAFADTTSSTLVSISPDEQLLATASSDGTVNIFEADSAKRLFSPTYHESQVTEIFFTADGKHMLTATAHTSTVWDLATGGGLTMRAPFEGKPEYTYLDGEKLFIKTSSNITRIDVSKMTPSGTDTALPEEIDGSLANQAVTIMAGYLDEGAVAFYDISGSKPVLKSKWKCPDGEIENWSLSPDGSLLAALLGEKIWIVRSGDAETVGEGKFPIAGVIKLDFSPDNRHLCGLFMPSAGTGDLPYIRIWDTKDLEATLFEVPERYYTGIWISPDGRWLAANFNGARFNPDTSFVLIDLHNPGSEVKIYPHPDSIYSMSYSEDSSMLGVSGQGGTLRVWDLATMEYRDAPLAENSNHIDSFIFSKDFSLIATISSSEDTSKVRVWDWQEAVPISSPWDFNSIVSQIHFSEDGRKLIAITPDEDKDSPEKHFVHIREILPAEDVKEAILPSAEATIARRIRQGDTPLPTPPGAIWATMTESSKDSWLRMPPENRNVSPGIDISTSSWMDLDNLGTLELTRAMPRVPASQARMADWRQNALSSNHAPSNEPPEARQARLERERSLIESIEASIDFAERNSEGDAETCYRLARQARTAGDNGRSLIFVEKALEIDPLHQNSLNLSADIATSDSRHEDAAGFLETLVEVNPDDLVYRAKYGINLVEIGKEEAGLAELRKVVDELRQQDYLKATALTALGRHQEALPLYQKLHDKAGTNKFAIHYIYLVAGHYYAGDLSAATEHFAALIRLQRGAGIRENIDGFPMNRLLKKAMLETLEPTLDKYPELDPNAAE